jgi:hypothetical protein
MANRKDPKTGRMKKVDPKRSKAAKKAAKGRKGKALKPAHKKAISIALKKVHKSGKTKHGRKAAFKKKK